MSKLSLDRHQRRILPVLVSLLIAMSASQAGAETPPASDMRASIQHLDQEWAHSLYQIPDKTAQLQALQTLAEAAKAVVAQYPGQAEPLLWAGIITSTEASKAGMFDQLSLVTKARDLFEKALAIDPRAAHGSIMLSLGILYYRVPGFPIAFGDNRRARGYLESALALDPAGLDANYFYGDFLIGQGETEKGRALLVHALALPPDPDRPVFEAGRRAEIRALLDKLGPAAAN